MTLSNYLPSIEEVLQPFRPAAQFDPADPKAQYWIKHGIVFFRESPVQGADSTTFQCHLSEYATDAKNVYYFGKKDRSLSASSFRCYSFAYHGDAASVRTASGGRIKDADVPSFIALDRGYEPIAGGEISFILCATGYARDVNRVYWTDNGGKAMHVVKADPLSFEASSAGFGRDDRHVFSGRAAIPKADPKTWRRLAGNYSTDGQRVYFFNRIVKNADPATIEAHADAADTTIYARDGRRFFQWDVEISQAEFERGVG
jgi:hypothetical protein